MGELPLEGIRVIAIGVVWAGPFATQLLADWGAEVIRVESLHHFTFLTRGFPMIRPTKELVRARPTWVTAYPDWDPGEKPWNSYPIFQAHGRNKLSCTMDLRKPKGLDLFKNLVAESDIVIQNNPTDTMEKLGITYETLREVKPDIILVAMPGYGSTGPYRNYRTLGSNLDEAAGHTWLRRYPDMDPSSASVILFSDASGGAHGAFAALAALRYKKRTGKGQFVDLSQVETIMPYLAEPIMDYTMNKRVQDTLGNRHPYMAPHGCYRCKGEDRWVVIAVNSQEEWRALCEVMNRPDLEADDRFADVLSRQRHQDELDAVVEEWTSEHENVEVMHRLQEKGVAAGAVLDDRDAYNDPHLKARGFFQEVTHPDVGTHPYPGLMWKASKTPNAIRTPPVCLGEHNEYVYKEILGVSDEEYAQLEQEGHIGTEPAPDAF
ncbi:MAG: CoA transferase [Deltaproteobacteria bacterium]|nr:CoA transferase [Deltaproteobacteria bacterium]